MEVWGRVLDLSQEEKNISQRTKSMWPGGYRATQKKKSQEYSWSVKESITCKGQRVSGSKARRGVELDGIRFERLGRGEFLGYCRVAGVQGLGAPQGQTPPSSLGCPNDMLFSALNAPSHKPILGLTSNNAQLLPHTTTKPDTHL